MNALEYIKKMETSEEFMYIFEFAHKSLRLNIDHDILRKAIQSQTLTMNSIPEMYTKLLQIGSTLGLQMSKICMPLENIFRMENKNEPWLIFNSKPSKFFGWIGIQEIRGKKAKVHCITGNFTTWLSLKKLKNIIGDVGDTEVLHSWLAINVQLPLSTIESKYYKKKLSPQKRTWKFLNIEKNDLSLVVIYSVVAGFLYLITPVIVQTLVNTIAFGTLMQPFVILTFFLFMVLSLAAIIGTLNSYIVEIIQQRLFAKLSGDLAYRLPRVQFDGFDYHHPPKLVNRFFDIMTIQKSASSLVIDGISIFLQTMIGMLFLMFYHPLLVIFNLLLFIAICFVLFILGRNAINSSVAESYAKYDMAGWLQDIVSNRVIFKSEKGLDYLTKRANAFACNYVFSRKKHFRVLLRQIIGFFAIQAFANAIVLGVGGYLVIHGELSLGQLVAAEVIVASITLNLTKFSKHLAMYYDLVAGMDKLGYLIDLPMEVQNGEFITLDRSIDVEVKKLSFSYSNGKKIFEDASMVIDANTLIGITGQNGSGKSTFIDLLYGLISSQKGTIHYNNIDIRHFFPAKLRSYISLCRGIEVFSGTIEENICLGKKIDSVHIEKTLESLKILSVIQSLPQGIKTVITPSRSFLSQGYISCLMIARAIISGSRLIIIDQLLDNLDCDLRNDIFSYLQELVRNGDFTLILGSYNRNILEKCDVVYEIKDQKFMKINK